MQFIRTAGNFFSVENMYLYVDVLMKGLIVVRNWESFTMIQNKITFLSFCVVFTTIQYS